MSSTPNLPAGFRFAGVACGIKASGKPDLSLIVAECDVTAAAVYTQNQVVAAPVVLCRERTPSAAIRAVVTNSGNANACTGEQGFRDAREMCAATAGAVGCAVDQTLVMSTGVIGHQLPMQHVRAGIVAAHQSLGSELHDFHAAAEAICTTDQTRKVAFEKIEIAGEQINIAAMCKGAGMIAPNMATMLAVVLTDACLSPDAAQAILADAAEQSFNRASVDGHTSTNDTLLLLASGQGESLAGEQRSQFAESVKKLCVALAKMIVADGEGASHIMAITVRGAKDNNDAEAIARTVAASPLVKTAITGGDPNWGRIVSAAGYAKAHIEPQKLSLKICGTEIYRAGSPVDHDAAALSTQMKNSPEIEIELAVGGDPGMATFWSSDLTTDYVRFNSEYTT